MRSFDQRHRLLAEGADGAAQHRLLRDHVVGVAGMHLGDARSPPDRAAATLRDTTLCSAVDDLGGDDHRIDAGFRPRAVRALAGDR